MQAAIVDDSSLDRDNLVLYIDEYAKSHDADIEPIAFPDASSFLREDSSQFYLVFFDIDMPGISGMEAARLLLHTRVCECFMRLQRASFFSLHHRGRGTASAVEGVRLIHSAICKDNRRILCEEHRQGNQKIAF